MSTRCLIGKQNKDNTITYIYCHHDGYLFGGVGQMLVENYQDKEKVDKLLALGDVSSIDCTPDTTLSRYEDCPAITIKNEKEYLSQDRGQDYFYLFKDNKWYFREDGVDADWRSVIDALEDEA